MEKAVNRSISVDTDGIDQSMINRWSQKSLSSGAHPMCKGGERHGESKVSCASTQHYVPARAWTQTSRSGVECSNHVATARVKFNELSEVDYLANRMKKQTNKSKWWTYSLLIFPVRKEMQFRQPGDFSKIDVTTFSFSDTNFFGAFLFICKSDFETIFL